MKAELLDCGHAESPHSDFTTGYGTDPETGKRHCYACCAERDKQRMRDDGRITLYLTDRTVTNWPGSLKIPVHHLRKGAHNMARTRYDVWFSFEGALWHGVQYGENTQICHCRKTKGK